MAGFGRSPRFMVLNVLFLILFLVDTGCGQTTIIAVRTANEIIIGADSRVKREDGSIATKCKIIQVRDLFLTFAGRPIIPELNFNAIEIAGRACDRSGSIASRVLAFEAAIEPELTRTVERVRQGDRDAFNRWYKTGDNIALQVIVAGIENRTPILYARE